MKNKEKIIQSDSTKEENKKDENSLMYLYRVVKMTRLNRINAANRLLETENFLQGINIYYSCIAAVLAVISLIEEKKMLSVWSTILTIILAISIVYLNAQKYGTRSQELKTNYIELHQLWFEIKLALEKNNISNVEEYGERYFKLLHTSENHKKIDYLQQIMQKNKDEISMIVFIEYILRIGLKYSFRIILIILPLIGIVMFALWGEFDGILW